jgi:hypothetical protein
MRREAFEAATRRAPQRSPTGALSRYRPQIAVSVMVVIVLAGGALYSARVSERAPQIVYSASLEEVKDEARDPLKVNIITADVDELDELIRVLGPPDTLPHRRRTS